MQTKHLPKYVVISNTLREQIESGGYERGAKLRTEKEYSRDFGVSRHTVRQAIAVLEAEGIVVSKHGSGTYVHTKNGLQDKSMTVGFISAFSGQNSPCEALSDVEEILSSRGYSLRYSCTRGRMDRERQILREYLRNPVDGLLVEATKSALPSPNLDLYEQLNAQGVPIVFLGPGYKKMPGVVAVLRDDYTVSKNAVEYLAERGRRRIGGVFLSDHQSGMEQYRGFADAVVALGLKLQDDLTCWLNPCAANIGQPVHQMIEPLYLLESCDGLVCCCDAVAVHFINSLYRRQVSVPEDVAVLSLQNDFSGGLSPVRLTSVVSAGETLGAASTHKLIRMMDGHQEQSSILPWTLREGSST